MSDPRDVTSMPNPNIPSAQPDPRPKSQPWPMPQDHPAQTTKSPDDLTREEIKRQADLDVEGERKKKSLPAGQEELPPSDPAAAPAPRDSSVPAPGLSPEPPLENPPVEPEPEPPVEEPVP